MKRSLLALPTIFSLIISVSGQKPTASPAPQPEQPDSDSVVRITANLVQVDAVVTDNKGRLVTDLRPEEIEIREDGQKITHFSFVSVEPSAIKPNAGNPGPLDKNGPPARGATLRPEQVGRTIALVVDDLGISFESIGFVRKGLKKFVDEQMQPGDLVAIIRTSAGMGALQQFTSDKRLLYAAIDRVRWNPRGRGGTGAFAAFESNPLTRVSPETPGAGGPPQSPIFNSDGSQASGNSAVDLNDRHIGDGLAQFRNEVLTVGTLGAVDYVVRGLHELPGRKSILLITDGLQLFNRTPFGFAALQNAQIEAKLRRLVDRANRASVVIYVMDSRGLQPLGLTAEDSTTNQSPAQVQARLDMRRRDFVESQEDMAYLPDRTGGFTVKNRNDLGAGIKQVLDDQRGYYLVAYRPDDSTFDPKTGRRNYHTLTVKVKGRPGVKVRYRSGFYGFTDKELSSDSSTRGQQLIKAISSPFASTGVNLQLTSLFGNDKQLGSFVRSLLYIQGSDLTFTEEADGWNKAVFDVLAVTFGDDGQIVDQISRNHTLRVRGAEYGLIRQTGLEYPIILPIKKSGAYQLRTAIRDTASGRIGSASQFIDVPDIGKNRLTLSGLVLSGVDSRHAGKSSPEIATTNGSTSMPGLGSTAGDTSDQVDPQSGPAVRRFRQGMMLHYSFLAYNAQLDKVALRPQLQAQVRLFRDGQPVFTGKVQLIDFRNQADLKRLATGGTLRLGTDLKHGEYVLQVTVTDTLAKQKHSSATQWIDFEIVK
ncbi:MAG TPA: VWA domain-containing protein [Pyrinomonadaceae bacterium]|nr:VWA domain-containing protein [Pyrinomonadaceae bacterium]